ncbi:hypothetical protein HMPREF0293_2193 [Corynebacterium glucuronolyticum ATCC 51866]|uniref:Uncharacterized protein n=2 Tax=Corynebacterium glucuronolyticum TaxID=39791 RepID=A0ABM9XMF4_9CORY|nr:hypothetical protein HMPREF0293_2193 [Corynebacterium glucuronolyticum ATCC 51866]
MIAGGIHCQGILNTQFGNRYIYRSNMKMLLAFKSNSIFRREVGILFETQLSNETAIENLADFIREGQNLLFENRWLHI